MVNQSLHNYFFEKYCISITQEDEDEILKIISDLKVPKEEVNAIFSFYNRNRNKMPEIKELSDTRVNHVKARLKKFGDEKVKEVILMASKSEFLNGINTSQWKANFDWIMKPTNFIKILEGNYQNKSNGQQSSGPKRNR